MALKIRTLRQVVIIVSSVCAVLAITAALIYRSPWWACLLSGAATYLIVFYISKFFLRKYIIFRIKPLYQLLLSRDISTSRLSHELRSKVQDDVVDDIQYNLDQLVSFSESEIERLREKERNRSEFMASVFHEIKTPVFNIQGYAQTLIDGALEDTEVSRRFMERTLRNIDRLSGIIEDIDKISRYEEGGIIIQKAPFDILTLVNELVDDHVVTASKNSINFIVDHSTFPSRMPVMVYADRLRIAQLIEKLIINALNYTQGKDGIIKISFVDVFDKILVEISDNGIGIPPEDIPHIFEKFYRVDKSRSRQSGGPGLGLSMAKLTLDAHGETITVRSQVGQGSTFSFTLTKSN